MLSVGLSEPQIQRANQQIKRQLNHQKNPKIHSKRSALKTLKNRFFYQTDKAHCWQCHKKSGILGFACSCGFTFCKAHRLPEHHDCEYNFAEVSKKNLAKANPVVKHDKIEKIN